MSDPVEQLPQHQWTRAEVKQAFREGRYEAIEQARRAGALDNLLSGKRQDT